MKRFLLVPLCLLAACAPQSPVNVEHFHMKSGTACAHIFYDVPDAPPLEIVDKEIDYVFDEDNMLYTSSPITFGWATEDDSGARKHMFYVDGEKIEEQLPLFTSAYQMEQEPQRDYTVIHFNDVDECFDDDTTANTEIFEAMLNRIYK